MPPVEQRVRKARLAVDTYRVKHAELYVTGWYGEVVEDHGPLLDIMKAALAKQGFSSLQEFWNESDELEDGWQ